MQGAGPRRQGYYSRTHCCRRCEAGEGHDDDPWACAGVPPRLFREVELPGRGSLAHCLVHEPPRSPEGRGAPAVLFLHGGMTYVYPETLWWDVRCLLEENAAARERFCVVAPFASAGEPLAVVSEVRRKEDRFGNVVPNVDDFDEETTWAAFLSALRSLGPGRVDFARLSVVGYSMGGQAAWHLAARYGSRLAAAAPFAGRCAWREDAWDMAETILGELRGLPIRSYCGEADDGCFSWRDFVWLARRRGLEGEASERWERHAGEVQVRVHEWGEGLSLLLLRGTPTAHCCWDPVLHDEDSFGLFTWLEKQVCATPADEWEPPWESISNT